MNFWVFEIRWLGLRKHRLDKELRELLKEGWKVNAIKLHRERTGSTLKDAKDYVDALQERMALL